MAAPRALAEVVNALVQRGVPEPVAIRMASDEGFRLYHGSPYDFEQFASQRHASTGMGAQVFGQGAYLAEREGVAEHYARRDVANRLLATGGEGRAPQFFSPSTPGKAVEFQDLMQRVGEDVIEQATQSLLTRRPAGDARFYRQGKPLNRSEVVDALRAEAVLAENRPLSATASVAALQEKRRQTRGFNELADMFERGDLSFRMPEEATGTMYEVLARARPEDFVEWDTPIRQHSERVQSALEQVYDGVFGAGEFEFRRDLNLPAGELLAELNRTADGNEIRQQLTNLGVPGARFGGDNYVVYDDGLLDILRKYGFGAAAVGLGSAVAAPQRAEAAERPQSPRAEMRAWDPTMRERVQHGLASLFERTGMSPYRAHRHAMGWTGNRGDNERIGLLDFSPAGIAFGAQEGARTFQRGRNIGGREGAIESGIGALEVGLSGLAAFPVSRAAVQAVRGRGMATPGMVDAATLTLPVVFEGGERP